MGGDRIADRDIGIVGMARSGLAAARLATRHGGRPFVSDGGDPSVLTPATAVLRELGVPHEVGRHSERLYACDYLVVSPGVPPDAPVLVRARHSGLRIYAELEFASWVCRSPIVAVTGSNGKTTTTALIAALLAQAGRSARACGNIGLPLSAVVDELPADAVAVVEASSFQLAAIDTFRPHVAAILNLAHDHLDWHGSLEAYRRAKHRVAENQTVDDWLIVNADDPLTQATDVRTRARCVAFSLERHEGVAAFVRDGWLWLAVDGRPERLVPGEELLLPGRHNLANAAAAALAASLCHAPPAAVAAGLRAFRGVEHRLELVARIGGVAFVNDSKATNVDAACVALAAIEGPIHLILGGRDKGAPYAPIARAARGRVRSVLVIGEAAPVIASALGDQLPVTRADSLEDAVRRAHQAARPGDTVLLSPACSSFDAYTDFEARGQAFKAAVAALQRAATMPARQA